MIQHQQNQLFLMLPTASPPELHLVCGHLFSAPTRAARCLLQELYSHHSLVGISEPPLPLPLACAMTKLVPTSTIPLTLFSVFWFYLLLYFTGPPQYLKADSQPPQAVLSHSLPISPKNQSFLPPHFPHMLHVPGGRCLCPWHGGGTQWCVRLLPIQTIP